MELVDIILVTIAGLLALIPFLFPLLAEIFGRSSEENTLS